MNNKLLIFLLIFSFALGYVVYEAIKLDSKFSKSSVVQTGSVLKNYPANLQFYDQKTGKIFDLYQVMLQGNHLVIHFWATWCAPCEVEFPELVKLIQLVQHNKALRFALISVDDDKAEVLKFLSKYSLPKESVLLLTDEGKEYRRMGTYKMPETYLFDPKARLIRRYSGRQAWAKKEFVKYFQSL
ncbi:MAG: TlpA family protein disulfide reductase [Halobacteriovoraceae bacterium]|jgi:cytochrome c biogenesis protein CcmG, thiol:disulfide interchange protein DsbE|nr:TlpA family protein disulfide reductase [Halobacteriovoraceae bacterium]